MRTLCVAAGSTSRAFFAWDLEGIIRLPSWRGSLPPGSRIAISKRSSVPSARSSSNSCCSRKRWRHLAAWREAWQRVSPGIEGRYLTADRAVMGPLRRLRLARAFPGPCVADMETAAAAAVAARAGVPWAALRVVTDRAGLLAGRVFAQNYPTLAGVPADTVPALLRELP